MIHRTMEQFLVLDSWVNITWISDYRLCLGTKKLLSNTHPSQGHMEEFKTKEGQKNKYSTAWSPVQQPWKFTLNTP